MRHFKSIIFNDDSKFTFHQDVVDGNVQIDVEQDGDEIGIVLEEDEIETLISKLTELKWLLQDAKTKESSTKK